MLTPRSQGHPKLNTISFLTTQLISLFLGFLFLFACLVSLILYLIACTALFLTLFGTFNNPIVTDGKKSRTPSPSSETLSAVSPLFHIQASLLCLSYMEHSPFPMQVVFCHLKTLNRDWLAEGGPHWLKFLL